MGHDAALAPGRAPARQPPPIRSRCQRTVFAVGLNLVVLTLRVQPPWGGEPIGLPINMRRYRKRDGRSLLDLSQEMIEEVAGWLPDHSFILGCDGAYSSAAGRFRFALADGEIPEALIDAVAEAA